MITGDSNEMKPLNLYTYSPLFLLVAIALLVGCSKEEGAENEDFPVAISTRIETDPIPPLGCFTARDPSQMQDLVVNIEPSTRASDFNTIASLFQNASSSDVKVGIGFIISYLHSSPSSIMQTLLSCFSLSEQYNIPIIIQP